MNKSDRFRIILMLISRYVLFFLLIAFIITCCISLFVTVLTDSLEITLTEEHLNMAAKLTFINIVILSTIFTTVDVIWRMIIFNRPVKKIISAAEKIMQGDFLVQISQIKGFYAEESFNQIIECFNTMAKELSSTETLKTDFISNVSHELKTPLTVMQNYGTLLQQPNLSEEKRMEYSKAICDASRKLANLITNILRLNKLENQQIAPEKNKLDLSEQVTQCLLAYENIWEEKEIQIETEIEDGITVCSDEELLSLVWNNLLSNAFKFTDNKGCVSVRLTADESNVTVRISDTGCGIDSKVGQHIFDKFYQGDTSHAANGNGLGLALVKRVIDIISADIFVESEKGKGSVFTVRLQRS